MATIRFPTLHEIDRWNRAARLVLDRANLTQPRKPPIPSNSTAIQKVTVILDSTGIYPIEFAPNRYLYCAQERDTWNSADLRWEASNLGSTPPRKYMALKNAAEDQNLSGLIRGSILLTPSMVMQPITTPREVEIWPSGQTIPAPDGGDDLDVWEFDVLNDVTC